MAQTGEVKEGRRLHFCAASSSHPHRQLFPQRFEPVFLFYFLYVFLSDVSSPTDNTLGGTQWSGNKWGQIKQAGSSLSRWHCCV